MLRLLPFREIWAVDFEFGGEDGCRPVPRCLVARELKSRRTIRVWEDELLHMPKPPYPTDAGVLFVAYYAPAEITCHLALGWPVPERIFDLFTEWRVVTNGLDIRIAGQRVGNSLLGAMAGFELDTILAAEKKEMRDLARRGGPWTTAEIKALLNYCEGDVDSLARLIREMVPLLWLRPFGLAHALIRGRTMAALAYVEHLGLPIDVPLLHRLRTHWGDIIDQLITEVDRSFGFYDGRSFRMLRFAKWLAEKGRHWPTLKSGQLDLEHDTFRDMAKIYPDLMPVHELRATLSEMRLEKLFVGDDGRNRVMLSAFQSVTGRNQPSNNKFIFGPATWLRGLIKPPPEHAFVYIDWSSQEIGIGAALSEDENMKADYASGDFYLGFAHRVGITPASLRVPTIEKMRDLIKVMCLGIGYGMGKRALAAWLGMTADRAGELIDLFWRTYSTFRDWVSGAVNHAMLRNTITTVFGWPMHIEGRYNPLVVGSRPNPRTIRNFPCQGNGAEMLRLALIFGMELGIRVVAPVHDAIAIEVPIRQLNEHIAAMQSAMLRASRVVLDGFELRTKPNIVCYPDRYADSRGAVMWEKTMSLLPEAGA